MSDIEKITKAIGAHVQWKQRLRNAIDTGTSEWTVEHVAPDNLCDFGKWLYSLPERERHNGHWKTVRTLHATFHGEAAKVLGLALGGKQGEANIAMEFGSNYVTISNKLTWAMMEWRKAIVGA